MKQMRQTQMGISFKQQILCIAITENALTSQIGVTSQIGAPSGSRWLAEEKRARMTAQRGDETPTETPTKRVDVASRGAQNALTSHFWV